MSRARVGAAAAVVGTLGVVVAAALPWIRSGASGRSAFGLARTAHNLGLAESPGARAALATIVVMPMLAAAVCALTALQRTAWVAALAAVSGVIAVASGVLVWRAPVPTGPGPAASVAA